MSYSIIYNVMPNCLMSSTWGDKNQDKWEGEETNHERNRTGKAQKYVDHIRRGSNKTIINQEEDGSSGRNLWAARTCRQAATLRRLQQVAARRTLMGGQWLIHGLADTLVMAASHIPSPPHADSCHHPWVICSERWPYCCLGRSNRGTATSDL